LWVIREARAQAQAANRADRLKTFGEELWHRMLTRVVTNDAAPSASREFQNESWHTDGEVRSVQLVLQTAQKALRTKNAFKRCCYDQRGHSRRVEIDIA
jgi:hypothetical protein